MGSKTDSMEVRRFLTNGSPLLMKSEAGPMRLKKLSMENLLGCDQGESELIEISCWRLHEAEKCRQTTH